MIPGRLAVASGECERGTPLRVEVHHERPVVAGCDGESCGSRECRGEVDCRDGLGDASDTVDNGNSHGTGVRYPRSAIPVIPRRSPCRCLVKERLAGLLRVAVRFHRVPLWAEAPPIGALEHVQCEIIPHYGCFSCSSQLSNGSDRSPTGFEIKHSL